MIGALSWPLLRGRVQPNRLYGFRFAKAFESEENWRAINAWGARRMLWWSGFVAIVGLLALSPVVGRSEGLALAAALAPTAYLIPCITTWFYSRSL